MNTELLLSSFYRKLKRFEISPKLSFASTKLILDKLYPVQITRASMEEAMQWCDENFGDDWIWYSPIQTDCTTIYFSSPEDACMFRLSFNHPYIESPSTDN